MRRDAIRDVFALLWAHALYARSTGACEVWIESSAEDNDDITVIAVPQEGTDLNGLSYHVTSARTLIERAQKDPNKNALIVGGAEAERFDRLVARERRMWCRRRYVDELYKTSIEDRLAAYVRQCYEEEDAEKISSCVDCAFSVPSAEEGNTDIELVVFDSSMRSFRWFNLGAFVTVT